MSMFERSLKHGPFTSIEREGDASNLKIGGAQWKKVTQVSLMSQRREIMSRGFDSFMCDEDEMGVNGRIQDEETSN